MRSLVSIERLVAVQHLANPEESHHPGSQVEALSDAQGFTADDLDDLQGRNDVVEV
jgi:hypothetical protein